MVDELKKITVDTTPNPTVQPAKKKFSAKFILIPLGFLLVVVAVIGIMLLPLRGVMAKAKDVSAIGRQTVEALKNQDLTSTQNRFF